jgi:hypothetical protein
VAAKGLIDAKMVSEASYVQAQEESISRGSIREKEFLEQLEGEGFVSLRHRTTADHVGKHNGCELALFRGHD